MDLKDFNKMLSEFYDDLNAIADEAVGGFAIDSLQTWTDKKKKKKIVNPLEEKAQFNRVMIDFDKTIYSAKSGWNDGRLEDDPFPEAKESIEFLKDKGYEIVIFTSRASEENAKQFAYDLEDAIQNVKNYLINNGIYFDRITGEKLAADFYIDDKVIHIKDGNWKDVISQLKKREKSL
jgi:phosphoglycolate phosphatase-like HAD superfamily hydrolase